MSAFSGRSNFFFNDLHSGGGAEVVFASHVRLFKQSNNVFSSVHVFNTGMLMKDFFSVFRIFFRVVRSAAAEDKIVVYIYNFSSICGLLFAIMLLALKRVTKKVIVFHSAHDYFLVSPARDGLAVDREFKVTNIYEASIINPRFSKRLAVHLLRLARFKFASMLVRKGLFDEIICPSHHLAKRIRSLYGGRVCVIRNPIGFDGGGDKNIGGGVNKFLIVGRLTADKGVLNSFDYWAESQTILPLVIIGDGPLRQSLVEKIGALPECKRDLVTLIGWAENEYVKRYYKGSILLFGSIWTENSPMVFLECVVGEGLILVLNETRCTREFGKIFPDFFISPSDVLGVISADYSSKKLSQQNLRLFSSQRFLSMYDRLICNYSG